MISSAAFPKVALRKLPNPSPARAAICSVACPSSPASGMIARHDEKKIRRWESGRECSAQMVIGRNISSQLSDGRSKLSLIEVIIWSLCEVAGVLPTQHFTTAVLGHAIAVRRMTSHDTPTSSHLELGKRTTTILAGTG